MKHLAAMLALTLGACAQSAQVPVAPPLTGGEYVAIGSSMAAGPGLGEIKPRTPQRCTRAFANYPTLLAERLRMTLYDVTCSGATTEHVLAPWDDLPAQIDAVTATTDLVTITIAGNDLNYVGNLLAAGCPAGGVLNFGSRTFPCPEASEPSEVDYAMVEDAMTRIARAVQERAPGARIVFVEYLRLVPDRLCDATPLSEEGAAAAREIADRLAQATRGAAKASGAMLVPVHDISAAHTACGDEPWSVGNPADYDGSDGAPWHPNYAGMRAVADIVAQRLGA